MKSALVLLLTLALGSDRLTAQTAAPGRVPPAGAPPQARPVAPAQPLPRPPTAAAPAATPDPFTPGPWKVLFDGKTVNGIRGLQKPDFLKAGWKIEDGALTITKDIKNSGKVTAGDLVTTEMFGDFEFEFEWKMLVSGDTGILYAVRAGPSGQGAAGYEFQLVDNVRNPDGLKGGPIRHTGALDRILPVSAETRLKDNDWNQGRLVVRGNHVQHWVNDVLALEYHFGSMAFLQAIRASKLRVGAMFGYKVKSGIIILDQGEEVSFRNLRVRALGGPITPGAAPVAAPAGAVPAGTMPPPAAVRTGPTPFKSRIP